MSRFAPTVIDYAASPFLLSGVKSEGVRFGDWLGNRSLGGQWVEHGWGFHIYLRRYDRVDSRFHLLWAGRFGHFATLFDIAKSFARFIRAFLYPLHIKNS